jgi:hypothetical protein
MRPSPVLTFNGPLEAGVRALAILGVAYPRDFDLQRMVAFDYLLVHTSELGGPDDLHPHTPIRTPATEVRRKVVQNALHLMMTRDLIERVVTANGIRFCAGEMAASFLDALQSSYIIELKRRATWLVQHLADYGDKEFDDLMRRFFDQWVVEFQHAEQSLSL